MATSASARLIFSTMAKGSRKNRNSHKNGTPITGMPAVRHAFHERFADVHDCSTTPLSSYQLMYTGWSQVGRATWRSALAMKAWTMMPEASLM